MREARCVGYNPRGMKRNLLLVAVCVLLAACAPEAAAPAPTATPALLPLPAGTEVTPAPTATTGPLATPVIIASPTPTPTPVTHVVQAGETLLSIALDYGVSLGSLQAVNPGVQVRFLSIGAVLIIPPPEGDAAFSATQLAPPPPLALVLSDPACHATATGPLYCLVEVSNPLASPAENISARVTLAGSDGLPVANGVGFAAVDLMAPHSTAPLAVIFQPPPSVPVAAHAVELLTADPATASVDAGRAMLLEVAAHTGQAAGTRLEVAGHVRNPTATSAGAVWVTVTVYDGADIVVGYRRVALAGRLPAGAETEFALAVDSLAGPIARYAIVAEGHP